MFLTHLCSGRCLTKEDKRQQFGTQETVLRLQEPLPAWDVVSSLQSKSGLLGFLGIISSFLAIRPSAGGQEVTLGSLQPALPLIYSHFLIVAHHNI